jgi:hypothetical protein
MSNHTSYINWIIFLLMSVLLFFMVFSNLFVDPRFPSPVLSNQLHVIWQLNFICTCFFPLWAHMTFVPLFYITFFHPVPMGEKHIIIYLFFEWFYITWKQENTFVLCLLPTWAFNMWSNDIIWKEFFLLSL